MPSMKVLRAASSIAANATTFFDTPVAITSNHVAYQNGLDVHEYLDSALLKLATDETLDLNAETASSTKPSNSSMKPLEGVATQCGTG